MPRQAVLIFSIAGSVLMFLVVFGMGPFLVASLTHDAPGERSPGRWSW